MLAPQNDIRRRTSRCMMKTTSTMRLARGVFPIAFVFAAVAIIAPADDAPGFHVWKLSEIEAHGKALAGKVDEHKVASETLAVDGNTTFMIAHREGSGQAEWHEKQADVIVISQGDVMMTLGGTVVDGKEVQPGEIRGSGIKGGTQVKLGPGDVEYIPPKTPHMMTLEPGKQVTYFVTKVVK
jgi:mannose-6-phosphate isomerase-like protein (cupin superfamily)